MHLSGTRQKAHIHVQARVATSMSPHGPDCNYISQTFDAQKALN